MIRLFFVAAVVLLAAACNPGEGERCNPLRFTDECTSGTHCVVPSGCAVAYCCPDGPSSSPTCAACASADGGASD